MSCERFAVAITDLACGADMTADLERHLAGCALCAARLEAHRRTMAGLDDEIQRALEIPVSGSFVRDVVARLEKDDRRTRWRLSWVIVPAAAAVLLAAWLAPAPVAPPGPPLPPAPDRIVRAVTTPAGPPDPFVVTARPAARERTSRTVPAAEVIVPPDRARAVSQFLMLVGRGTLDASKLAASSDSSPVAVDLTVPPLTVAPIVLPGVEFVNAPATGGQGPSH